MAASTELRHPLSEGLHALPMADVLGRILQVQSKALMVLEPAFDDIAKAAVHGARALGQGGRIGYAGAGSSGIMALADCLELPGTFGITPDRVPLMFAGGANALLHMTGGPEDDRVQAVKDFEASGLTAGDVVLCLAASGRTPYTLAIADAAKAEGVRVVGIANVAQSPLLQAADVAILLDTGAEIIAGSTRMGAATAQKTALNMISVLVALQLGHVHDGYMVNVVADNIKLAQRAVGIVSAVAGVTLPKARAALDETQGAVKPAILVARGVDYAAAKSLLRQTGGHLAPHLASETD